MFIRIGENRSRSLDAFSASMRRYDMVLDELQATACLAHLDLSEEETAAALPAFEQMLEYFAAMKAADEDEEAAGLFAVDPSDAPSAAARMRPDTFELNNNNNNNPHSNPLSNLADELLDRAPESENRFIVIPNVL